MTHFSLMAWPLRDRLKKTRYEDIEEFKVLLMLERLILQPLRNSHDEALFVGLKDRFRAEAEFLTWELRGGGAELDYQTARVLLQTKCEVLQLRGKRLNIRQDQNCRERAAWLAAGELP
jgi:hypothetical protein